MCLLALLVALTTCIPFRDNIALAHAVEVGRDEDPDTWSCHICNDDNRPLEAHVIHDVDKETRATLARYEEYCVLSFRYTENGVNLLEDVVYISQVRIILFSTSTSTPAPNARFRRSGTTCGTTSATK